MRVELDIFSGRPNPAWEATPEEEAAIRAQVALLTDRSGTELSDRLGYRGFVVTDEPHGRTIRVQGPVVEVRAASGWTGWADPGRSFESTLAAIARSHISPELYELLIRELGCA
ncbi:hypothetical protein [Saccharopolyspora phatthalungensis]|uniref:Uncharacterized protein n=1 Tax=Saccharopolyspora phatthalungensis TaxID=664693 RepID=A0A840QJ74_9PSEU|nr:hypothetical protein [Saccharopolyspora phatthalungensis]MBB5159108.1 hypothetical protein [Saccharopolyspora phatthalungensis]